MKQRVIDMTGIQRIMFSVYVLHARCMLSYFEDMEQRVIHTTGTQRVIFCESVCMVYTPVFHGYGRKGNRYVRDVILFASVYILRIVLFHG